METVNLIRQTGFEELVQRYKLEADEAGRREEYNQEVEPDSPRNVERKNIIARQVQEAQGFLCGFGKSYSDMTVDEFEIVSEELRKRNEDKLRALKEKLANTWFFRFHRIINLNQDITSYQFIIEHGYGIKIKNNQFLELVKFVGSIDCTVNWKRELPPNLENLVNQIFVIRFGDEASRALKFEKGGE